MTGHTTRHHAAGRGNIVFSHHHPFIRHGAFTSSPRSPYLGDGQEEGAMTLPPASPPPPPPPERHKSEIRSIPVSFSVKREKFEQGTHRCSVDTIRQKPYTNTKPSQQLAVSVRVWINSASGRSHHRHRRSTHNLLYTRGVAGR